jgi:Cu/Ag efflux protein CusF
MFFSPSTFLPSRTPALGAALLILGLAWGNAQAQGAAAPMDHSQHGAHSAVAADAPAAATDTSSLLTSGEITRVDARSARLTIRHGDITNLGMPAMTMVFVLQDRTQLAQFKPGDQVRFHAEDTQGQLLITHIEAAH